MGATGRVSLLLALGAGLFLAGCGKDRLERVQVDLVAQPLDFGPVEVGDHQTGRLRLTNAGRAVLHVREIKAVPPFAAAVLAEPLTIEPGTSRDLQLQFSPDAEGPQQQKAAVLSDADQSAPVLLKGFGARVLLNVAPQKLDFGSLPVGTSKTLSLLLANEGNVAAQVALRGIDGIDASAYLAPQMTVVPAHGQASLEVQVGAQHLGPIVGTLHLAACKLCNEQSVALTANGIQSSLDVEPSSLDFGSVAVGANASRTVTVTNAGSATVNVSQTFVTGDSDADFSANNTAFSLAPGAQQTLTVQFTPTVKGARHGTFRINSDDPLAANVDVALQGAGDMLMTFVDPRSLDFGTVAVGMTARQVVTVYNTSSTLNLTLKQAAVTQGVRFAGGIAGPVTIGPGDHYSVPVAYTPTQPSQDTGVLELVTDENGTTTVDVSLKGQAVQLPPCQWAAHPGALDFGTARAGQILTLAVDLQNTGTNDCAFSSIDLTPASDGAFALPDGAVASKLLHAGEWTTVRVSFSPYQDGTFAGALQFFVSDPSAPVGTVALSGAAAEGCLVLTPPSLNFGTVPGICPAPTQTITAHNSCNADISISSVALGSGRSTEFSITAGNTAAHTLAAGQSESVSVTYQPTDDSLDLQGLVWTLADGGTQLVSMQGVGVMSPTQTDHYVQKNRNKVDQLFVIDNSGSMADKQDALAQNFQAFLQQAVAQQVDFHIAVTTTGLDPSTGGWTQCPGGANGGEDGRFFPADNSSPRILTPQTPDLSGAFSYDVHVGTCHWLEQGLEGARLALSQPLVGEVDDPNTPLANDGNAGFLRADARLSIIVVSDADDQSPDTVANYEAFFKSLKGNDPGQFVFSGIVTPDNKATTCPNGESSGDRYMQLAAATGGTIENICTSDWGTTLAKLSMSAFGPTTHFPLSVKPSDPGQITVVVNGQQVTAGWSYDAATNTVIFDDADAPPAGSTIDITYPVGC